MASSVVFVSLCLRELGCCSFFLSALFGSSLNFNFYIGVVFQWIFSPFSFAEVPAEQLRWFFPMHRAY
jgi:hypothetical protein